jgi:hypothetical protein
MLTHFFTNYYTALGKASDTAASHIASIVEVLKPPSTDSVALDAILQAMSVGISLMPGPEGGAVANAIMSGLEVIVPYQLLKLTIRLTLSSKFPVNLALIYSQVALRRVRQASGILSYKQAIYKHK